MLKHMGQVKSSDACPIAYEVAGSGTTIMLIDGALCFRQLGPSQGMSTMLVDQGFRVVRYDRRGRGESGTAPAHTVQQEIDDIAAVANLLGEEIHLWGVSSGGLLAMMAAAQLPQVRRVAVYEAPVLFDRSHEPMADNWRRILSFIEEDDRPAALKCFLAMVGMPAPVRLAMSLLPIWKKLKVIAPTLANDARIGGPFLNGSADAFGLLPNLSCDLQICAGTRSPPWLVSNNKLLAGRYQQARFGLVEGDDHLVRPDRHRALLGPFFGAAA